MSDIPYVAFESTMARLDRLNKRNFIVILVLLVLLFATNGAWLYHEKQYDVVTETTTITQTNEDGVNNFIGNDGEITNGEADDYEN